MMSSLLSKRLQASLCIVISVLVSASTYGQVTRQWVRFFDDPLNSWNQAKAVVTDDMGNVYVTGESSGNNSWDIVTTKYKPNGTVEWVARYDGFHGVDYPTSITMDMMGNIYVAGGSEGNGTLDDVVTIKYNNAGVQQWVARYNGPGNSSEHAFGHHGIKADNDGNVYVVGLASTVNNTQDYVTIKYNTQGVEQWVQYYNGPANGLDWPFSMALDPVTADVYVTGFTELANSFKAFATVKYNNAGILQWVRTYNESYVDQAVAIGLDVQGNIYITGSSGGSCLTIKYDASGMQKWTAHYTGPQNTFHNPVSLGIDNSGNVYIAGYSSASISGSNPVQYESKCFTLKYNSQGVEQWVQLQSGTGNASAEAKALVLDEEGNVYVTGYNVSSTSPTNKDYMTIKYNSAGVQQWIELYDAFGANDDAVDISVNKSHDVFVSGTATKFTNPGSADFDYLTIKYVQAKPLMVTATPDTTVYLGYGSNCMMLKAAITGGVPPYTIAWSPSGTAQNSQTTTVCPTSNSIYTVMVTDATGTVRTAQSTITVTDVRCGNQNNKVIICHKGKELCVAASAVAAHINHGDFLGMCQGTTKDRPKGNDLAGTIKNFPFIFTAYPNPVSHISTISYQLPFDAQVTITLLDLYGREIQTIVREKKRAGSYTGLINVSEMASGTYLYRMILVSPFSHSVHTQKLIVLK
jgi:hypothetical protein